MNSEILARGQSPTGYHVDAPYDSIKDGGDLPGKSGRDRGDSPGKSGKVSVSGGKKPANLGPYDVPTLHVDVVKAKNLVKADIIGKSDPYVVLQYGNQTDKTPVIKNTLNPQWDHS